MENNKLSDLQIKTEHINGTKYNEITIDYQDSENQEVKYRFAGKFDYKLLDFFTVLVEEYEDKNHKTSLRVTIFTRLDEGHIITSFPVLKEFSKVTEGLRKIKKLIIPYFNSYVVYSYEFGYITSAIYDKIFYDEETQTFHVEYLKYTSYGFVRLFGTLDSEGHLINDTLFIPELDLELLVDEHNLEASTNTYIFTIEKAFKRKNKNDEQKEFNEWEYQHYLNRKRKNSLEK